MSTENDAAGPVGNGRGGVRKISAEHKLFRLYFNPSVSATRAKPADDAPPHPALLAAAARDVARADPAHRIYAFADAAERIAAHMRAGRIEKAVAIDFLWDIAGANDIVNMCGADAIARQIDAAFFDADDQLPDLAPAAEPNGDARTRGRSQADVLVRLAQCAEFFHSPDGTGFADLDINGHRETWPVRSRGFRRWLARRYYDETGGAPRAEALGAALDVIEARAAYDAPVHPVHVRVADHENHIYIDLADPDWRVVDVDATGWRIIDRPPVRFRRAPGMLPLPVPVAGGSIDALRKFLNVSSDADFVLVVAWALACLRNRGPYPVMVLSGEQGSAKSTFSAILRALLDPNTAPLRALPREDRDLFIAASNGHVLAFDNVSGLPAWISDTLCRLASGGGFAVRKLFTDQSEVLFDTARPVILNGIEDIVTRPDLADRALFLTLEPIPEERRRPERELWAAFEAERPRILGALLDAASRGLAALPSVRLDRLPRLADFAVWATACEAALWPAGTFAAAYGGNRAEAVEAVIDADPVAGAVRALMVGRAEWTGTASDLLAALAELAGERAAKAKNWPGSPQALSGKLRRAAPALRRVGIHINYAREGRARTRIVHITAGPSSATERAENGGVRSSTSSAPSAPRENTNNINDLCADDSADNTVRGAPYRPHRGRPSAHRPHQPIDK